MHFEVEYFNFDLFFFFIFGLEIKRWTIDRTTLVSICVQLTGPVAVRVRRTNYSEALATNFPAVPLTFLCRPSIYPSRNNQEMEDRHQARPQHNFSLPWPLTNQKRLIRRRRMLLISSFGHSLNAACSVIFFQALPSLRSPPKTCHRISSFFSPSHPVHSSIYLTSNGHLAVKQRKNKKKTFCALRGPVTNMTLFYFKENSLLVSLIVDGLK